MDERRRHDLWRQLGLENDNAWDRVSTACAMVLHHVHVDAVAVSCPGWETRVTTDSWAEQLEEYQYVLGEGPGPDVVQTGLGMLVPDVSARAHRWPAFAERAAASNLAAVFAFPVQDTDSKPMGALVLYRRTTGRLSTAELRHTAVMAGFTAKLLEQDTDQPEVTILRSRRATIAAATDLLATRHGVNRDDALVLLRAHAFVRDQPLHLVAEAVVDRGLSLDDN
jgi:ANTAR domain